MSVKATLSDVLQWILCVKQLIAPSKTWTMRSLGLPFRSFHQDNEEIPGIFAKHWLEQKRSEQKRIDLFAFFAVNKHNNKPSKVLVSENV